jgi:hypothetical protein
MHEFIHIVGAGARAYMEHTREWAARRTGGNRLVGTWATVGATGRWPECVNLWELTLDDWLATLDHAYVNRQSDVALEEWWKRALEYRSGGEDRMLVPAPWSPPLDDLLARRVRGVLFVHELSSVRAGAAADYLAAMEAGWLPLARGIGLEPIGAYEGLTTDTETLTVWAVPDLAAYRRYLEARLGDPTVAAWRRRAREWVTCWRETLMHPGAGTPLA